MEMFKCKNTGALIYVSAGGAHSACLTCCYFDMCAHSSHSKTHIKSTAAAAMNINTLLAHARSLSQTHRLHTGDAYEELISKQPNAKGSDEEKGKTKSTI